MQYASQYRQVNFKIHPIMRGDPTVGQSYVSGMAAGSVYRALKDVFGMYVDGAYDATQSRYASQITLDAEL